jgi:hypothetical protein
MASALARDRSSNPLGFIIVCFVLSFLGAGYVFGLFQTIGYEDRTEKFESGRGISGGGTTVGPKLMFSSKATPSSPITRPRYVKAAFESVF